MSQEGQNIGPFNPGSLINKVSSSETPRTNEVPLSEAETKLLDMMDEMVRLRDSLSSAPIYTIEYGTGRRIEVDFGPTGVASHREKLERMLRLTSEIETIGKQKGDDKKVRP